MSGDRDSCSVYEVCCGATIGGLLGSASTPQSSLSHPRASTCGLKGSEDVRSRISSPQREDGDAEFGEYPWQSAVLKKEGVDSVYVCAGTLVDDRHILTAAHCVTGYSASELRVRLGEWDVNSDTEFYPYVESDVVAVYVNPDYFSGNLMNDLAVVRMAAPVDLARNPHIGPICLPHQTDFTGHRCWVSGWGKDGFGDDGRYQSVLKEVSLTVVPREACQAALRHTRLGPRYVLHPGMICAGGEAGKDACKGDGGGPLACKGTDGRYQLAGVVSWGIGCGAPGVPGVYVNIPYYTPWLRDILRF